MDKNRQQIQMYISKMYREQNMITVHTTSQRQQKHMDTLTQTLHEYNPHNKTTKLKQVYSNAAEENHLDETEQSPQ
jgi:hypothetical protein